MDNFEEVVTSLIDAVPDAALAALLGMDGVGVEIAFSDAWRESDPSILEVELAAVAVSVQQAAGRLDDDSNPDFFMGTAQINFLGTVVDPAFFLVLGLEPTADLTQAQEALHEARQALGSLGTT